MKRFAHACRQQSDRYVLDDAQLAVTDVSSMTDARQHVKSITALMYLMDLYEQSCTLGSETRGAKTAEHKLSNSGVQKRELAL